MVDRLERTFPHQPHLRGVGYVGSNLWALSDKELEGHMWVCWDPLPAPHFRQPPIHLPSAWPLSPGLGQWDPGRQAPSTGLPTPHSVSDLRLAGGAPHKSSCKLPCQHTHSFLSLPLPFNLSKPNLRCPLLQEVLPDLPQHTHTHTRTCTHARSSSVLRWGLSGQNDRVGLLCLQE